MRRKVFFGVVLALSMAAIVLVPSVAPAFQLEAQVTFAASELLGRPTDSSVTVNVVPSSATVEVYFEYGTASGVYTGQTSATALVSGTPNDVVMQGLAPNTRYFIGWFQAQTALTGSLEMSIHFMTQRAAGSTFTFTITADSHVNITFGNAVTWQQTLTNIANDHPDFEIDLGDTFAMDGVTTASGADQAYLYQRQFFDIVGASVQFSW